MPCNPSDNTLNPIVVPTPPIPGFGIAPTSPINSPIPGFTIPTNLVEDLLTLVNQLKIIWPSGILQPNIDGFTKTVLDGVIALFNQLAPFLSLYKFFTAALNMINCVIEVLCALPNPVAVINKLVKLFTECLPPFIALFPFAALIIMILSILLLLLALIEYLITTFTAVISDLLDNFKKLSTASSLKNAASVEAITLKINALLCDLQNLLAVLSALGAIFAIIETLAKIAGGTLCASDDSSGCCGPDVCPPFIANSPNGISGTNGKLIYLKQEATDIGAIFNAAGVPGINNSLFNLPDLRAESWQLVNLDSNPQYPFSLIIQTNSSGNAYFPEGKTFKATTNPKQAPYTADLRISLDPFNFHPSDLGGNRFFRITDCIVIVKPYLGVLTFNNSINPVPSTGTLSLQGGKVFEDNGTPYLIGGVQATLNTFIHLSAGNSIPVSDDAVTAITEFTLKINHAVLASEGLISFGCIPQIALAKNIQNSTLVADGIGSVDQKIPKNSSGGILPDVGGAQQCIQTALDNLKKNITLDTIATFQAETTVCLNTLKTQTLETYCGALIAAVSQFKTTVTLTPFVQLINREIVISVNLKDMSGTELCNNLPIGCQDQIAKLLTTETTFGEVGLFTYDGQHSFVAFLKSNLAGSGILKVLFNQKIISQVVIVNGTSIIQEVDLPFSFINTVVEPVIRHDVSDVK